jgi:hypothetical protein
MSVLPQTGFCSSLLEAPDGCDAGIVPFVFCRSHYVMHTINLSFVQQIVVERISGCNHMTCRCGSEFCIVCGSQWQGGCMRHPPCSTLSAAELEQERIRGAQRARPVPVESRPANGIGLQQMTTETLAAAASRQNDQRNTSRRRSFAEVMQRLLASNPQRTPTRLRVEPAHRARRTARARAPSFGDVMRQVFTK